MTRARALVTGLFPRPSLPQRPLGLVILSAPSAPPTSNRPGDTPPGSGLGGAESALATRAPHLAELDATLRPPSERPAASRFPKPCPPFLGACARREPAMHPTAPVPRLVAFGIPHGRSAARRTRAASRTAPRPLALRYPTRGRGFLVEGESQPSPKARQHGPTVQPNSSHPKTRPRFRAGVSQRFASPFVSTGARHGIDRSPAALCDGHPITLTHARVTGRNRSRPRSGN